MSDYGIKIARPGMDAKTATNKDLLLNLKYPFTKLDQTNPASFQNITLYFINEPPDTTGTGIPISTKVYSFPHGYTYIPRTWLLYQNNNNSVSFMSYGQEGATIASPYPLSSALLQMTVDSTNVNFYVVKTYGDNTVPPALIRGYTIKLRVYVFAENVQY